MNVAARLTVRPPEGAGEEMVTVAVLLCPPTRVAGVKFSAVSAIPDGCSVNCTVWEVAFRLAEMVTVRGVVTAEVKMGKFTEV